MRRQRCLPLTAGGETIAQAAPIPMHLGSLVPARQDACDRCVTVLMARQQYGVVLQEPGLNVDQEATQRLRTALRTQWVEALHHTHESVKRDGTSGKE